MANKSTGQGEGLIDGTVTAVNMDTDTCDFESLDGSKVLLDVKLTAVDNDGESGAEVVSYPVVGCFAVVAHIGNEPHNTMLVKCSQIASVKIKIASVTMVIDSDGNLTVNAPGATMVFNGGDNAGLVNIKPLVKKINALENKMNEFLRAFKIHSHPGNNFVTTTLSPDIIDELTEQVDLEDTKIKH